MERGKRSKYIRKIFILFIKKKGEMKNGIKEGYGFFIFFIF